MPVYLVIAYAIFWIFTFALVLSIWIRQRRLKRDLEMLEEQLEKTELPNS